MGLHIERRNAIIPVPLGSVIPTGSGSTWTRDAAGAYSISLPTSATAYLLGVPLNSHGAPGVVAGGSVIEKVGFMLEELLLWYIVGTADTTLNTFNIFSETIIGGAARAAPVALGGTLQVSMNDGALSGSSATATLTATQSANAYKARIVLGTPVYLGTNGQLVTGEWLITTGSSGTVKIHGIQLKGRIGMQA